MSQYTGVGTDLFVKKKRPGAEIGKGYIIEIYENGIKMDTVERPTKDQVKDLLDEYKLKYHTDRSFMNESQIHVTYKTKEERGEAPDLPKGKEPQGVKAMESLDQILIKKANKINLTLQKLLHPSMPIKIREAELEEIINKNLKTADVTDGQIDFIPTTPGSSEEVMTEPEMGTMIATKFVEFVNTQKPVEGAEWVKLDEIYNPIKKWLAAVKKKLKDWEKMSDKPLDIKTVIKAAEDILFSSDPAVIKKATGINVSPEVASKIKEVALTKAGLKKDTGKGIIESIQPTQKNSPTQEIAPTPPLPKMASSEKEEKDSGTFMDSLSKKSDSNRPEQSAKEIVDEQFEKKKEFGDESSEVPLKKILESERVKNDNTYAGMEAKFQINPDKVEQKMEGKTHSVVDEFFKYASEINDVITLENAFIKWAEDKEYSVEELQNIYNGIVEEINLRFGKVLSIRLTQAAENALETIDLSQALDYIYKSIKEGKVEIPRINQKLVNTIIQSGVVNAIKEGLDNEINILNRTRPHDDKYMLAFDAADNVKKDNKLDFLRGEMNNKITNKFVSFFNKAKDYPYNSYENEILQGLRILEASIKKASQDFIVSIDWDRIANEQFEIFSKGLEKPIKEELTEQPEQLEEKYYNKPDFMEKEKEIIAP